MPNKRIAIVGSGVSGLGALHALQKTHHEVHLFEADSRWGGHTNTVMFNGNDKEVPVDTGFIVMNTATYPNFIAFLKEININTAPSEMTFSVSRDKGAFEWAGNSLGSLFAQGHNLFRPSMWRMLFDIVRFNLFATDILSDQFATPELSIGEYLERNGYSDQFRDDYLIPMTACVWSTGPEKCALEFPAVILIRFLWNHRLLNTVAARPQWLTIPGGAKRYVDAVVEKMPQDRLHLATRVRSAKNEGNKVVLSLAGGGKEEFDAVILACHGDQARSIVSESISPLEKKILGAFETTPNKAYIHSDTSLMPRRRITWSAWNYLTTSAQSSRSKQEVCLTYNMNILQGIPRSIYGDVLVTLNPMQPPSPVLTQGEFLYRHWLCNARAIEAQEKLHTIQGKRGIWYAGAWTGYGFHEDGFTSGVRVAVEGLGGQVGWNLVDAKHIRGKRPTISPVQHLIRLWVLVLHWVILIASDVLNRGLRVPQKLRLKNKSI